MGKYSDLFKPFAAHRRYIGFLSNKISMIKQLAICFTACLSFSALASNDNLAVAIASMAKTELESTGTPSLQIAIGHDGQTIYTGAFGYADLENQVKASNNSKYRTASIAKWFTATLAIKLAEQGQIDLDSNITEYCQAYPEKNDPITTRQLLTHSAGIRGYLDFEELLKNANNQDERNQLLHRQAIRDLNLTTPKANVDESISAFADDPLLFSPGSNWTYTSFGYRLLSCVLQGASDQEFSKLMAEQIFKPLSMDDTVPDTASSIIPGRVSGYEIRRGHPTKRAKFRDVSENLAAGGYLSTASDLVKFANAFNHQLISDEHKALMLKPVVLPTTQLSQEPSWRDAIPTEGQYGYGIMTFDKYTEGLVGHTGRQDGGSGILLLLPDQDITIAVVTNAKGWNGYLPFATQLLQLIKTHVAES